jgi:hypothetical protein
MGVGMQSVLRYRQEDMMKNLEDANRMFAIEMKNQIMDRMMLSLAEAFDMLSGEIACIQANTRGRSYDVTFSEMNLQVSMHNLRRIFSDIGELIHEGSDCNYMASK